MFADSLGDPERPDRRTSSPDSKPFAADDQTGAKTDHVEWFFVGLIVFGLIAESAIVLHALAAAP